MTTAGRQDETRRYGRAAGLLSAGIALGGLLIYAYFLLASHNLPPHEYGEIVVLWLAIVVAVSILFRPIEQLLARTIAEARGRGADDSHAIRVAARIHAFLAGVFVVVLLVGKGPIEETLFSGDETLYLVLLVGVSVYGVDFFLRGVVAGRGQFHLYAALLLVYGIVFVAFAAVVALDLGPGFHWLAAAIAVAPLVGVVFVLAALVWGRRGVTAGPPPSQVSVRPRVPATGGEQPGDTSLVRGTGFAAAVLLIMLSEQILISSGPLIVRATDGAAAAGLVFNVLMIARAPIALFQGIAASLLPHLARLRSQNTPDTARAFGAAVRGTVLAVAGFGAVVAAVVFAAGPQLMQAMFGDSFDYGRDDLVIVAAGLTFFLCAATLNQPALARGQAKAAATAWVVMAVAVLGFNAIPILDAQTRVEWGFAGASAALSVVLLIMYRRPDPGAGTGLEPGSAEELQARLAAAEEGG